MRAARLRNRRERPGLYPGEAKTSARTILPIHSRRISLLALAPSHRRLLLEHILRRFGNCRLGVLPVSHQFHAVAFGVAALDDAKGEFRRHP